MIASSCAPRPLPPRRIDVCKGADIRLPAAPRGIVQRCVLFSSFSKGPPAAFPLQYPG